MAVAQFVALVRAVNVAGHGGLAMADLRRVLAADGRGNRITAWDEGHGAELEYSAEAGGDGGSLSRGHGS